jgi:hypothetical protein
MSDKPNYDEGLNKLIDEIKANTGKRRKNVIKLLMHKGATRKSAARLRVKR